jgi:flagella basal body P-ring formation protein FlgA
LAVLKANRDLAAGRTVEAGDVVAEPARLLPGDLNGAHAALTGSPDTLLGSRLRRAVARGTPLRRAMVDPPLLVERGAPVALDVVSGRARLRLIGTAESGGRLGERILLRLPDSKRPVEVEVTAAQRAVLRAGVGR